LDHRPIDFSGMPSMRIMTRDGRDVTNLISRTSKTKEQREHTHLMRILKACDDCRRKKSRCDPSHRSRRKAQPAAAALLGALEHQLTLPAQKSPTQQPPSQQAPAQQPPAQHSLQAFSLSSLTPSFDALVDPIDEFNFLELDMQFGPFNNGLTEHASSFPDLSTAPTDDIFGPTFDFFAAAPTFNLPVFTQTPVLQVAGREIPVAHASSSSVGAATASGSGQPSVTISPMDGGVVGDVHSTLPPHPLDQEVLDACYTDFNLFSPVPDMIDVDFPLLGSHDLIPSGPFDYQREPLPPSLSSLPPPRPGATPPRYSSRRLLSQIPTQGRGQTTTPVPIDAPFPLSNPTDNDASARRMASPAIVDMVSSANARPTSTGTSRSVTDHNGYNNRHRNIVPAGDHNSTFSAGLVLPAQIPRGGIAQHTRGVTAEASPRSRPSLAVLVVQHSSETSATDNQATPSPGRLYLETGYNKSPVNQHARDGTQLGGVTEGEYTSVPDNDSCQPRQALALMDRITSSAEQMVLHIMNFIFIVLLGAVVCQAIGVLGALEGNKKVRNQCVGRGSGIVSGTDVLAEAHLRLGTKGSGCGWLRVVSTVG